MTGPRRLSPRVLVIDPVRILPQLFVPILGVLLLRGFSPSSFVWVGVGAAFAVIFSAVRWASFTYQIYDDRIELVRNLITRSVRTIPLQRVRGVDITARPLHRLLDLAVVRIETAASGSDGEEGKLDAVRSNEAEQLRALLLKRGTAAAEDSPPLTAAPVVEGAVYAVAPYRWLLYGPLSGAYLLTPFAVLASVFGLAAQLRGELGVDIRSVLGVGEWIRDRPVLLIIVALALIAMMPLAGVVMYGIFNWNFTLRGTDVSLIAERGLFTRRSVSLERRRIRGFELVEGLLERPFRVARLWAIVTGLGDVSTRGLLLPSAPKAAVLGVAARAITGFDTPLVRHPRAALQRRLFRAIAPWVFLGGLAIAAQVNWAVAACAVLAIIGIPLGLDRYRSLGHAFDGARLSVRSGSLRRRRQAVVERSAVVGWTLKQTLFQRQAGLLTVVAGVGAGEGGYEAIDVAESGGVEFARAVTPGWIAPFTALP